MKIERISCSGCEQITVYPFGKNTPTVDKPKITLIKYASGSTKLNWEHSWTFGFSPTISKAKQMIKAFEILMKEAEKPVKLLKMKK